MPNPITLKINGVDRTDQVQWSTFRKLEVLTKEPDILDFSLKNFPSKTFRPSLNDEIIVEQSGSRIFGGSIVETEEIIDGQLKFFRVGCKDFTHLMDKTLVVRRYENFGTANDIIADIFANFVEAGFTLTNVNAPITIDDVNFNHFYVSDALQKLADLIGFDWYVDYDKDVHFFSKEETISIFSLFEPTEAQQIAGQDGNFVWNSLIISENIHQLRNKIIVRGGTVLGNTRTVSYDADGDQVLFLVGQNHINLTVKKNAVTQTLGKEGIDDGDVSIATLYNPNSGYVRFKTKPTAGDTIAITSTPAFPLIKVFKDNASITKFGEFEFVLVDKNIKSSEAATLRARGELLKWADEVRDATFTSYRDGLRVGEIMIVNLPTRSINRNFQINRIVVTARDGLGNLRYDVSLLASEKTTMIDILSDLLINRPNTEIQILEDEIIDLVEGYLETIDLAEAFVVNLFPSVTPDFVETISFPTGEAVTTMRINPFNPPEFVAGSRFPTSPSDAKRHVYADSSAFAQTP